MKFSNWNRRAVVWIGGLFIAAIVALAAYDIVESYQTTVRNTGRELDAQARLIAEQTARSLQAVDVVLRHLAQQHQQGAFDAMSDHELHLYLREQAVGLVQIEGVGIIGPNGTPRALSMAHPPPVPNLNVANLGIFKALKAGHSGLYIDDVVRRVQDPGGVPLVPAAHPDARLAARSLARAQRRGLRPRRRHPDPAPAAQDRARPDAPEVHQDRARHGLRLQRRGGHRPLAGSPLADFKRNFRGGFRQQGETGEANHAP
jgi:hypothetical protein